MAAAAAAANGNSDDDSDDQKSSGGSSTGGGGKTQSRIDKWKAKHEEMMRIAEGKNGKEDDGDEEPEAAVVGEHIGEVKDEDEDEEEEVAVASAAADKGADKGESDEPEIPNIDGTNGVCIDLNGSNAKTAGSKAAGKPHTRHSAVQQQVRTSMISQTNALLSYF